MTIKILIFPFFWLAFPSNVFYWVLRHHKATQGYICKVGYIDTKTVMVWPLWDRNYYQARAERGGKSLELPYGVGIVGKVGNELGRTQ